MTVVERFDEYINDNYSKLKSDAQRACWNDFAYEDIFQDNIVKVRNRIINSGFTKNQNFGGYLYFSVFNDFKLKQKRQARKRYISINDEDHFNEVESALSNVDHSSQLFYDDLDLVVKSLFKYLDTYYNERYSFLFKTYYLTTNNTYNKLAAHSRLDYRTIKSVISRMKKDIRLNLINYTKHQYSEEVYRTVNNYSKYMISNKGKVIEILTGKEVEKNEDGYYNLVNDQQVMKEKSIEQLQEAIFKREDIHNFCRRTI
jgi:DNA-directed RNA polymerase specialized sigma24 family protein